MGYLDRDPESVFYMPSGYRDADVEMSALEEAGNLHAARIRRYGKEGYARLQAGETIEHPCHSKETGEAYAVLVRLALGELLYSTDGELLYSGRWFNSAKEAYSAAKGEVSIHVGRP